MSVNDSGSGADLKDWLKDAAINTDQNLRLQYLAGVGLNNYTAADISEEITKFRKFPSDLFIATDSWKASLKQAIGATR